MNTFGPGPCKLKSIPFELKSQSSALSRLPASRQSRPHVESTLRVRWLDTPS